MLKDLNNFRYVFITPEMFLNCNIHSYSLLTLYNFENLINEKRRFTFMIFNGGLNEKNSNHEIYDKFKTLNNLYAQKYELNILSKLSSDKICIIVPNEDCMLKRLTNEVYRRENVTFAKIENDEFYVLNGNKNSNTNKQPTFKLNTGKFIENKKLLTTSEIKENSYVYNSRKERIQLVKKLGSGGEGTVYLGSNNAAIKIVKLNKLTIDYRDRIEFMVSHNITKNSTFKYAKNICWPQEALYDSHNNFVGYSMENVYGINLYEFVSQREDDSQSFGIFNLTKKQIVDIIIRILEMFSFLHFENIVVGDIKLENIVFRIVNGKPDINQIYFVDVDSYQVDRFYATAVSNGFIAPEFKKDEYRTKAEDNFAIFSLLFMILFKGKKPYNQIKKADDDTSYDDDVRSGRFPYSNNEKASIAHIPPGYAQVGWAHLPIYIRNEFISNGYSQGNKFQPEKRTSSAEWLRLFKTYKTHLDNGVLSKLDPYYNVGIFKLKDAKNYYISFDCLNINLKGELRNSNLNKSNTSVNNAKTNSTNNAVNKSNSSVNNTKTNSTNNASKSQMKNLNNRASTNKKYKTSKIPLKLNPDDFKVFKQNSDIAVGIIPKVQYSLFNKKTVLSLKIKYQYLDNVEIEDADYYIDCEDTDDYISQHSSNLSDTKFRINGKCERFNCSIDITVKNLNDGKTSDLDFDFDVLKKQVIDLSD